MTEHRIFSMSVASVYRHYLAKVEKKGRSREELDTVISWQTGYGREALAALLADGTDFRTFFVNAPRPNPARHSVTGLICGVRIETIEDPLMREIRILDRLVDELARGRKMEKILRA